MSGASMRFGRRYTSLPGEHNLVESHMHTSLPLLKIVGVYMCRSSTSPHEIENPDPRTPLILGLATFFDINDPKNAVRLLSIVKILLRIQLVIQVANHNFMVSTRTWQSQNWRRTFVLGVHDGWHQTAYTSLQGYTHVKDHQDIRLSFVIVMHMFTVAVHHPYLQSVEINLVEILM